MNYFLSHKNGTFALVLAISFGLAMAGGTSARAADQNGGVPGDWLSRYAGARALGFGGAFVATADEPLGVVWNPAGLSQMFQNGVHFETAYLFEGTSINAFSFGMPARWFPSFGLTVLSLRSDGFERTTELNESLGSFYEGEMAFLLSASKNLSPRLSLGANVKVVRQTIEEFDAAGVGADFGLLLYVTPTLRLGTSLLNVGGPRLTLRETDEVYPLELRGGFSKSLFSDRGLITFEIDRRSGPGVSFHGGSEFWVHPSMALRLGYYDDSPTGGFSYRFPHGIRLDYGVSDHELGVIHRIGLSFQFGGFFASSEAIPPVFSPIGEQSVTKFHLKAKTKASSSNWSLEIVDKSNQMVRRFSGKGAPPAHVMWDGKDESGLSLADGLYSYLLTVEDQEGRKLTGPKRTVEITTSGPQGTVPIVIQ
jgi:hypothetical protein